MSALGLLRITSIWGKGMSGFDAAVEYVLENEGGLSEDENDPGGVTNFGVSLRFLRSMDGEKLRRYGFLGEVDAEMVRNMSLAQARAVYKGEFWEGSGLDGLREQEVANYVFDMCVNMGRGQGIKLLQRATWAMCGQMGIIKDDGICGERTISLANAFGDSIMPVLRGIRGEFYRSLGRDLFLHGWLVRTYRV